MEGVLEPNWWAVLIRGLLAIGFGFVAWAQPRLSVAFLLILFGAYALDDGIMAIVSAVRAARRDERWWPMAVEGVLGVLLGLATFLAPEAAMVLLFVVIAIWALVTGALELVSALRLRREIPGEWLLALSGLVRLAFGIVLITRPDAGIRTMVWMTASYAIAYGVLMVLLSLRLRYRIRRRDERRADRMMAQPT